MLLNVNPVFLSPRHLFTTEDAVELRLRHFGMKLKENKKIRRKKYKKIPLEAQSYHPAAACVRLSSRTP